MSVILAARRLWKRLPLARVADPLVRRLYLVGEQASRWGGPRAASRIAKGPLVISGFFGEVLGLGRAARLTASALEAAGLPVVRHDLRPLLEATYDEALGRLPFTDAPGGGVWILHCNAPEAEIILRKAPQRLWRDRYRIAIWAWELEAVPEDWRRVARDFHEIWAPSAFVAAAIAPHARKVQVMPHPLNDVAGAQADRARFGFKEGEMVFAALADARSTLVRKNPLGAVEAFKRAFPAPDARARLVIKLVYPHADPQGMASLEAAIARRPDISLYLDHLSDTEMLSFLASIDGLVALHRSEGFGLVIAEAMALAKPVVATGWSGNLDFMTGPAAEGLVPYALIPSVDPSGRYEGSRWADPDLDHAAALIRRLVKEPAFRALLSEAGPPAATALNERWTRDRLLGQQFAHLLSA